MLVVGVDEDETVLAAAEKVVEFALGLDDSLELQQSRLTSHRRRRRATGSLTVTARLNSRTEQPLSQSVPQATRVLLFLAPTTEETP